MMNEKLKNIIKSNLADNHVLMDYGVGGRGNYVRIVIDSPDAVTLGETTTLTKILRDSDKMQELFPDGFRLEVTTPGIGQPLEHKFQYLKSINRDLNVKYTEKDELMSISGKLIEVSDDFLKVKMKKDIFKLNFDQILSAKVKIAFK